jgi:hypothetical protein
MDSLSQPDQCSSSTAPILQYQWPLRCQRSLHATVVIRDDRGRGQVQRPLDLSAAMVESAVVAIDHKSNALQVDLVRLEQTKGGSGTPETDDVGRRHEEDLVGKPEGDAVDAAVRPKQIWTNIENHVPIARP